MKIHGAINPIKCGGVVKSWNLIGFILRTGRKVVNWTVLHCHPYLVFLPFAILVSLHCAAFLIGFFVVVVIVVILYIILTCCTHEDLASRYCRCNSRWTLYRTTEQCSVHRWCCLLWQCHSWICCYTYVCATQLIIWRVPDSEDAKVMATGVEVLHRVLKVSENFSRCQMSFQSTI